MIWTITITEQVTYSVSAMSQDDATVVARAAMDEGDFDPIKDFVGVTDRQVTITSPDGTVVEWECDS